MSFLRQQLRRVRWSVVLALAIALAALVWTLATEGLAPGLVFGVAVAAIIATLWNPWERRPRPELSLDVDGQATGVALMGRRRPLDIEALVEDAVRETRRVSVSGGLMAMTRMQQGYAEPTPEDHEKFNTLVDFYRDDIRAWLGVIEEFLVKRSQLMAADIVTSNEADVDAENAAIELAFPPGFTKGELDGSRDEPSRPEFPRRRSALWLAQHGFEAHRDPILRLSTIRALPLTTTTSEGWEPSYDMAPDGTLLIAYPRQTIHHRERHIAGDEFVVKAGVGGDYSVSWTVSAANLPKPRRGSFKVEVSYEVSGDAVTTMDELRALLRSLDPYAPDDDDE